MQLEAQLTGLNRFLATVYDAGVNLDTLLDDLGFDAAQRQSLGGKHRPAIAAGLVEVIRKRLTWEDKDLWFRVIARRLGLDGEPPASIEDTAGSLNIDVGTASAAEADGLQRCRSKAATEDFKRELRRIALEQLSAGGEKPAKEAVLQKLERLADLRSAADMARIDYEARRAEVMKKIQEELDAIEVEFKPALEAAETNAAAPGGRDPQ